MRKLLYSRSSADRDFKFDANPSRLSNADVSDRYSLEMSRGVSETPAMNLPCGRRLRARSSSRRCPSASCAGAAPVRETLKSVISRSNHATDRRRSQDFVPICDGDASLVCEVVDVVAWDTPLTLFELRHFHFPLLLLSFRKETVARTIEIAPNRCRTPLRMFPGLFFRKHCVHVLLQNVGNVAMGRVPGWLLDVPAKPPEEVCRAKGERV